MLSDSRVLLRKDVWQQIIQLRPNGIEEPHYLGGSVYTHRHHAVSTHIFDLREIKAFSQGMHFDDIIGYVDTSIKQTNEFDKEFYESIPHHISANGRMVITDLSPLTGVVVEDHNEQNDADEWHPTSFWGAQLRFEEAYPAGINVDTPEVQLEDDEFDDSEADEFDSINTTDSESIDINFSREAKRLSEAFRPTFTSDFFRLDNGNIGVPFIIYPDEGELECIECILEYTETYPEDPPDLWVVEPPIPDTYEQAVETDDHGDTRIDYIQDRYWGVRTQSALEYIRKWALDYSRSMAMTDRSDTN